MKVTRIGSLQRGRERTFMEMVTTGSMKLTEKFEYAITLIESMNANEKSPVQIVCQALSIMDFGDISVREMLNYLETRNL